MTKKVGTNVFRVILAALVLLSYGQVRSEQVKCLVCHAAADSGLEAVHGFPVSPCASCHLGDETATEQSAAHQGLVPSPGQLSDAEATCGKCHASHVHAVVNSRMHTGKGIVQKTRELLGMHEQPTSSSTLQTLGEEIPDSLMRKLCAGCHLGRELHRPRADPLFDRGGGCLACHLGKAEKAGHAPLHKRIEDQRCLGCHSRSGRISLNYAGLAEIDPASAALSHGNLARLGDGRLVRRLHADIHQRAGLSCIDCHTGPGLMGFISNGERGGIDIRCEDCHANRNERLTVGDWPNGQSLQLPDLPFAFSKGQQFLRTSSGTPLWHIQVREEGAYLFPKLGGSAIRIPMSPEGHMPLQEEHRRLTCDTCHANWAPTCLGCHIEYDPEFDQWDHLEKDFTAGAWKEARWEIDAAPPILGFAGEDRISVFVPGMIMTLSHPDLEETVFLRHFAELSPHTSGRARGCEDCHRSSASLGLGKGKLRLEGGALRFSPSLHRLRDGLPADAWASLDKTGSVSNTVYPRPFNVGEIKRIFSAVNESHGQKTKKTECLATGTHGREETESVCEN